MVKVKLHADGSISTEASSELSCPLCVVGNAAPPAFVSLQPAPVPALTYVQPGIVKRPFGGHTAQRHRLRADRLLFLESQLNSCQRTSCMG
jgi:hypothetical protein